MKKKTIIVIIIITLIAITAVGLYLTRPTKTELNKINEFYYYSGSSGYAIEFRGRKTLNEYSVEYKEYNGGEQTKTNFTINSNKLHDILSKMREENCKKHTYKYQCGEKNGCAASIFYVNDNDDKKCYKINEEIMNFFDNLKD